MRLAQSAEFNASSFRDLLFILDVTGSQGPYIESAKQSVETICTDILKSDKLQSPEDLRFGLIAFRDHPPQDCTFVTREWDFTPDVKQMLRNLKSLPPPSGGGDGPEAVTTALSKALTMKWRKQKDCRKIVVLISDAPPHGIGSQDDGFPDGVPNGELRSDD
jgi:von Willebrand factor type A domain